MQGFQLRLQEKTRIRKILIQALKIAIGSCAAIYLAHGLGLAYATSAGTIALLTIVATRWETLRLSLFRLISFAGSVLCVAIICHFVRDDWVGYGIFIFFLVVFCEILGWKTAISVNAVIGSHFFSTQDFSPQFIENELLLVCIGISAAIVLNFFGGNRRTKKSLIQNMRSTEERLQMILGELAAYLSGKAMERDVWQDIITLEHDLQFYSDCAHEYENNTFYAHTIYYINYFEMRKNQCGVLHNLHYEMKRMRQMPKQAAVVADYLVYLLDYVVEINAPDRQIEHLEEIFDGMREEPLPKSREEFENRALLYHILMDIEEFLVFKRRFVQQMDEEQQQIYWKH